MTRCPGCGKELKLHQPVAVDSDTGSMQFKDPGPGDVTICGNCTAFLRFNPDMTVVELNVDDILAMPDNERITLNNLRTRVEKNIRRRTRSKSTVRLVTETSIDVMKGAETKQELYGLLLGSLGSVSEMVISAAKGLNDIEGLKVAVAMNLLFEYFRSEGDKSKMLAALEKDLRDVTT